MSTHICHSRIAWGAAHVAFVAGAILLYAAPAEAALNAYLELEANGSAIEGYSSIESLDREGKIECLEVHNDVKVVSGVRRYAPVRCLKRVDRSSAPLHEAMINGARITATFRFYRPSLDGSGRTEHFFTLELSDARLTRIDRSLPSTVHASSSNLPMLEELSFVFRRIRGTYHSDGAGKFEDTAETRTALEEAEPQRLVDLAGPRTMPATVRRRPRSVRRALS